MSDEAILGHVARFVQKNSLHKVLEFVYDTKPLVEAKKRNARGQPLKMILVDNELRVPGLELERVLASVRELDEGGGMPLSRVLASLK